MRSKRRKVSKRSGLVVLFVFASAFLLNCKNTSDSPVVEAIYQGEKDMSWAIAHCLEYPQDEGIVKVSFQVDKEGNVNEVKAVLDDQITQAEITIARKKLENKEVLPVNFPVLQSLIESIEKLNFEPAEKGGNPINSTIVTSVEFMLI